MDEKTSWSAKLKEALRCARLTQKEAAERLGIPTRTLEAWAMGERTAPEYVQKLLLTVLRSFQPQQTQLDLETAIQVRGGVPWRWQDAQIVSVAIGSEVRGENEAPEPALSFTAKLADGSTQHIHDAFGWASARWRYKENRCEQCRWSDSEGGDTVAYGATTAQGPKARGCSHPDVDEDADAYNDTDGGRNCQHHEFPEE